MDFGSLDRQLPSHMEAFAAEMGVFAWKEPWGMEASGWLRKEPGG